MYGLHFGTRRRRSLTGREEGRRQGTPAGKTMNKEELVDLLRKILETDADLDFLFLLGQKS
jgi:hypothetical protein